MKKKMVKYNLKFNKVKNIPDNYFYKIISNDSGLLIKIR